MAILNLQLLRVSDLKVSSAPRKRVYLFVKADDGKCSNKRSDHDTFTNRASERIAISFHKRETNTEAPN